MVQRVAVLGRDPVGALAERAVTRRTDLDREFRAVFVAQYDAIVQSVTFVCGDRDAASDATQEAFIRAYARWSRVRRYDNVAAWIRRIAINITRDARRSESRRSRREQRVAGSGLTLDPADAYESPLDLLAGLPDRQRAIAALYYLDDLPVAEISRLLDIAEGTVRFHLNQARDRLRKVTGDRSGHHAE